MSARLGGIFIDRDEAPEASPRARDAVNDWYASFRRRARGEDEPESTPTTQHEGDRE